MVKPETPTNYASTFAPKYENSVVLSGLINCGWNEKKNSCDDLEGKGTAYVNTADSHYRDYMPHGWMKTNGAYSALSKKVFYDAVPVYGDLSLTYCTNQTDICKDHHGSKYWTGIKTTNRGGFMHYSDGLSITPDVRMPNFGYTSGGACPPSGTRNAGKTPCPQRRCTSCSVGNCQSGSGHWDCSRDTSNYQYLCARSMSNQGVCQPIGHVSGSQALSGNRDALGEGWGTSKSAKTQDNKFKNANTFYGYAQCTYPEDALVSDEQVKLLYDMIQRGEVPGNREFVYPLMRKFCSRLVNNSNGSNCIANHHTAVPQVCSKYTATSWAGGKCREFLNDMYNQPSGVTDKSYDEIIRDHCDKYPLLDECLCRRRSDNDLYNLLVQKAFGVQQGNPFCWWAACRSGLEDGMFRDREIERVARANDCKTTICANINNYINSHYNDTAGAAQEVSCMQGDGGGGVNPGTTTAAPGVALGAGGEEGGEDSIFGDNIGQIIGISVGVTLAVVGLFYLLRTEEKTISKPGGAKKAEPEPEKEKKIQVAGGKGLFGYLFSEEGAEEENEKKKKNKKTGKIPKKTEKPQKKKKVSVNAKS